MFVYCVLGIFFAIQLSNVYQYRLLKTGSWLVTLLGRLFGSSGVYLKGVVDTTVCRPSLRVYQFGLVHRLPPISDMGIVPVDPIVVLR